MSDFRKNFLEQLKQERTSYKEMIDFCCDGLILNNYIEPELAKKDIYFEDFCGTRYDEEIDEYVDIYQQYIIRFSDAERIAEYTNELVIYNEELDLYLLCVTHYGTPWERSPF